MPPEIAYCHHCGLLMQRAEFNRHQREVVKPLEIKRRDRGGVFVTVDGDEYWAPTVEELRAEGFKVVLRYSRRYTGPEPTGDKVYDRLLGYGRQLKAKGGSTYILLLAPDGQWAEARVNCSNKDVFSKRAGYVLACCKALSQLGGRYYSFDREFLTQVEMRIHEEAE